MPKVEWGKKVVCSSCEVRFYDLNRKYPLSCPSCGSNVEEAIINESASEAKKIFADDVTSKNQTNLVGSDPTESTASDESLALEEVEDDETISLEEADTDVGVIDTEVDDLSIEGSENQDEEDQLNH